MAKKRQKQTLREFKAWLQGVEELQPDNWSPNREQWQLIRQKIDNIVEERIVVQKEAKNTVKETPQTQMPPRQIPQQGALPPIPPPPPVPGSLPNVPVEVSPEAKKLLDPAANGGKIKTPDIDTTDGTFKSPFE